MFIAGFAEADIVGACEKLEDPDAPVWSKVHVTGVEAMGCGTLAYDAETDSVSPHIHTALGVRRRGRRTGSRAIYSAPASSSSLKCSLLRSPLP
jgi:hypothetical protein